MLSLIIIALERERYMKIKSISTACSPVFGIVIVWYIKYKVANISAIPVYIPYCISDYLLFDCDIIPIKGVCIGSVKLKVVNTVSVIGIK